MSYIKKHTLAVTTDAAGAATVYTAEPVTGKVVQYRYVPHGSTPLATGADIDVTGEETGVVVVNQDNIGTAAFTKIPRQATHDETGAASLYAAGGEPVEAPVVVAGERLKLVVAGGGDTLQGTFYFWVE